jgi:virginiamycin B lyase
MVFDSEGTIFFDEFGSNKIASMDRATMAIREYPLPDAGSRPRRIAIGSGDIIWYSDYALGCLGRLDPKSGKVTEYPSPSGPRSQPYGIAVIDDIIWYNESGVQPNTLVRFDPKTEKFETWAIPSGGGVVRNMMPTRDGNMRWQRAGSTASAWWNRTERRAPPRRPGRAIRSRVASPSGGDVERPFGKVTYQPARV